MLRLGDFVHGLRSKSATPSRELAARELGDLIDAAVATLPPKQRAVFLMRHRECLSYPEIAVIMERSEGGVRANYFQALQKLKRELDHHEDALDE